MNRWPKTWHAIMADAEPAEHDLPLIPADLGRELYEALKDRHDLHGVLWEGRVLDLLARYEREVDG
jgi:hypothetical protein